MISGLMALGERHTKLLARATEAEQELCDIKSWLVMLFDEKHQGAEEFLRAVAAEYAERTA